MAAAGVQLHFVFADNEPGIELLRDQGGRLARRLQSNGKLDIRMIPGADHTFTDAEARERLFAALTELVDASAASEPAAQLPPTG